MEKRNQKTKQVGNGEMEPYWSEKLQCWVWQYYDTRGKRQTLKQRKKETKKQFWARYIEIKESLNKGTYVSKSKESIVSIAEHHINLKYKEGRISARSYKREMETLGQIKKTCSDFCNIPIQNVNIKHLEDAKIEIMQYANNVIDKIWGLLKKVFKIASSPSRRILIFNIMEDETLTKPISVQTAKKVKPLTKDERKKLIEILDGPERNHKYRNAVKMQLVSGMRIGEVLARSEDDYTPKDNTFNVWNTLTQDENYKTIWSEHTKTFNKKTGIDEGQRFLPLDSPLFIELNEIIQEEKSKKIKSISNKHSVLFWDYKNDTYVTPGEIDSWLTRLNNKYKITKEPLTSHRLRHTAITHWYEIGIPIEVIQYLAGHVEGSDITSRVYIGISFEFVQQTLSKIS